ncbi:MAG: hypothetical protein WAL32_00165 [Terriglobales bacterium]
MATASRFHRQKISTTIAPDTLAYLQQLLDSGEATTLAEAIDLAVSRLRTLDNRRRLARDTAAYFNEMPEQELAEESRLASVLSASARSLDFDREP